MSHCTQVQERIALGQLLPDIERDHLSSCEACTRVAESYSLLDASLESLIEPVPPGFAERVMSRLGADAMVRRTGRFHANWTELVLFAAAFGCALLNTVRFVAGVLLPSVSLGGTP